MAYKSSETVVVRGQDKLRETLERLPLGDTPNQAYQARTAFLGRVFDHAGITDPIERERVTEYYIGKAPSDAPSGDSTSDWWKRTAYKTAYSTGATFEGLRALYNDATGDPEDRDKALANAERLKELYASVPNDDSFWQDLVVSSPTMLLSMGVAIPVGIVASKAGAGFKTATAISAFSSYLTNIALNTSGSFTEAMENPATDNYLKQIFGEDVDLKEKKLEIAREDAKLRAVAEAGNPANIITAFIDANPALSGLGRLGLLGRTVKDVMFRTPTTKLGKMFPNIRDVAVKAGLTAGLEGVQEGSQDLTEQAISLYQGQKLKQRAELGITDDETELDLAQIIKDIDYGSVGYSTALGGTLGGMVTTGAGGIKRAIDLPRERIRTEVRQAVMSGDKDEVRRVFDKFGPDTPQRVIAESEYEDIQKGIYTDYRVDKDKTRYKLRSSLAQAFESGEQDLQRWILEHRDSDLSASVVEDFFKEVEARKAEKARATRSPEIDPESANYGEGGLPEFGEEFGATHPWTQVQEPEQGPYGPDQEINPNVEREQRRQARERQEAETEFSTRANDVVRETQERKGTDPEGVRLLPPGQETQFDKDPFVLFDTLVKGKDAGDVIISEEDKAILTNAYLGDKKFQEYVDKAMKPAEQKAEPKSKAKGTGKKSTTAKGGASDVRKPQKQEAQEGSKSDGQKEDGAQKAPDKKKGVLTKVSERGSKAKGAPTQGKPATDQKDRKFYKEGAEDKPAPKKTTKATTKPRPKETSDIGKEGVAEETQKTGGLKGASSVPKKTGGLKGTPKKDSGKTKAKAKAEKTYPKKADMPFEERVKQAVANKKFASKKVDGKYVDGMVIKDDKGNTLDFLDYDELQKGGFIKQVDGEDIITTPEKYKGKAKPKAKAKPADKTSEQETTENKSDDKKPKAEKEDKEDKADSKKPDKESDDGKETKETKGKAEESKGEETTKPKPKSKPKSASPKKPSATTGKDTKSTDKGEDVKQEDLPETGPEEGARTPDYVPKRFNEGKMKDVEGRETEGKKKEGGTKKKSTTTKSSKVPPKKSAGGVKADKEKKTKDKTKTDVKPEVVTKPKAKAPVAKSTKERREGYKKTFLADLEKVTIQDVQDYLGFPVDSTTFDLLKQKVAEQAEAQNYEVLSDGSYYPLTMSEEFNDVYTDFFESEQVKGVGSEEARGASDESEFETVGTTEEKDSTKIQPKADADKRPLIYASDKVSPKTGKRMLMSDFPTLKKAHNSQKVAIMKLAEADVIRYVSDIENISMMESDSASLENQEKSKKDNERRYRIFNKRTGNVGIDRDQNVIKQKTADLLIKFAKEELDVDIPVLSLRDREAKDMVFTYGEQAIGQAFVDTFGSNVPQYIRDIDGEETGIKDIVVHARYEEDGQLKFPFLKTKDLYIEGQMEPIKNAPDFVDFQDFIDDLKTNGVKDARIEIDKGQQQGAQAVDAKGETVGLDSMIGRAEKAGEQVVVITLAKPRTVQGINNGKPVDVVYRVGLKAIAGAPSVKALQKFSQDIIMPSLRPKDASEIKVDEYSIAPSDEVGKGLSSVDVLYELASFRENFKGTNFLKYKVFDDVEQARSAGYDFREDGRGAYSPSDNTVLLIANNIRDLKTARMVLFHESIGHAGVRMTLGDTAFESLIDAVIKERKLDVKAKAKQLGIDDRMAVEEMIAELAEGRADQNLAKRIMQTIRDWFERFFGNPMSDAELRRIVIDAEKKFMKGELGSVNKNKPVLDNDPNMKGGTQPTSSPLRYSIGTEMAVFASDSETQFMKGKLGDARKKLADWMNANLTEDLKQAGITEGISPFMLHQDKIKSKRELADALTKASEWSIENRNANGGWYFLPDGGWRFEIPDVDKDGNSVVFFNKNFMPPPSEPASMLLKEHLQNLRMKGVKFFDTVSKPPVLPTIGGNKITRTKRKMTGGPLLNFFRHKGLEEAYPELMKSIEVQFANLPAKTLGGFSPTEMTIVLSDKIKIGDLRTILLHELTHAIQQLSGLASGGNTDFANSGLYNVFDRSRGKLVEEMNPEAITHLSSLAEPGQPSMMDILYEFAENHVQGLKKVSNASRDEMLRNIRIKNPMFLTMFSDKGMKEFVVALSKNITSSDNGKIVDTGVNRYEMTNNDPLKVYPKFLGEIMMNNANVTDYAIEKELTTVGIPLGASGPMPFSGDDIYYRLLGEMEARDVEYRSFASGLWHLKETRPFIYVKEMDGIKSFDDAIIAYTGDIESGSMMKEVPADVKKLRYSIAPNQSIPITSRRSDTQGAPSWMSEEQARVFGIPQFGNPVAGKSFGQKMEIMFQDIGMKLRQGVFDRFASFKRLGERIYIKARMSNASEGALDALFRYGQIRMDEDGAIDIVEGSKSMVEVLSPLGSDLDVFLKWVASKRHQELKNDPDFPRDALKFLDDDSLRIALTFNQGDTINAVTGEAISREKLFDAVYEDFKEIQNSVTKIAEDSGLISAETAKVWRNQFYVPFYRVLDEEAGETAGPITLDSLVNQRAYNKLKGSDAHLGDILQNTLMNMNHLISASLKNNSAKEALAEMSKKVPGGLPSAFRLGEFPINEGEVQKFINDTWSKVQAPPNYIDPDNAQVVHVLEDGKRVYYKVLDPLYMESLSALNKVGQDNPFFNFLRGSKRWYTYSVTASPEFKIRNLIRDSLSSLAVSPTSLNVFDNAFGTGWKGTAKDSKTWAQLVAGGGSFSFGSMSGVDSDQTRRLIESNIKKEFILDNAEGHANLERSIKSVFNLAKKYWGKYDDFGSRLENVNRASLYDKLRKEGKSHLEASYQARDLLDFSNHGSFGAILYLANFSPFLNARLQGLYKIGKTAVDPQQMARFYSVVGGYVTASLALYMAYKDDEDFQEREDWDRDTYHWFKLPGFGEKGDIAFRIPKAFEMGVIATLAERMLEQMVDDKVHGKLFFDRLWHATTDTFAFDVRPMPLRPIWDVYANKNPFTGRPIESLSMQNMSPEERRNAYTSEFTTLVSRGVHDLVPWDAVTLSPVQLEYLVNGWGGYLGATVLEGVDALVRTAQGKDTPTRHWSKYPVVKALVDDPKERIYTKHSTMFYNMSKEMSRTFRDIKELRELGDIERARTKQEKNRLMLKYRKSTNRLQRRASEINNEIARITADPNMDGDLKKQRINILTQKRNAILKSGVLAVPDDVRASGISLR